MQIIILLEEVLRPHLGWHGARLALVATFLIALFRVKTINLSELAVGFVGKAKAESHYKRLQRFFREFEVDYSEIVKMFSLPSKLKNMVVLIEVSLALV